MSETVKKTFSIAGMSCASCAASVEKILGDHAGVSNVQVNFPNSSALIEFDKLMVQPDSLKSKLNTVGYDLFIDDDTNTMQQQVEDYKNNELNEVYSNTIYALIFTLPIVVIGMFFMDMPYANWIMLALSVPVVFVFGKRFYISAYGQLKNKSANMDSLVAISTGIAFAFSLFNTLFPEYWLARGLEAHVYFEAAAAIIAFILLGKYLEEKAKSNTSSAIKSLIGLQPKTVSLKRNNAIIENVPVNEVNKGDVIIIKPGERLPVDGIVKEGSSFIDESMISGESIPVEVSAGSQVYAGTINQKGSFNFVVEKKAGETILAQIIKMVQEAQGSKAPVQKIVDKVASIFVPVVIVIAIVTFTTWMILGGEQAFTHALLTSVTVLVIACPCALGLATPTAIMVGIGKGAEHNILIKDAISLELAYKVDAVVLDKTGTITEGKPCLDSISWHVDDDTGALKNILFSIESLSEHPLADAIVSHLKNLQAVLIDIENTESVVGRGITSQHNGMQYFVGNLNYLIESDVLPASALSDDEINKKQSAKTLIYFANEHQLLATISITDKIKPSSKNAINILKNRGIKVYMLTGDNANVAADVASQLGLTAYKAGALPIEKADFIKKLQDQGAVVAMAGDGINDSQALAQADLSIAMGRGSDIAIDVAKLTLITSDLNSIPAALNLSHRTVSTIKQNLFWAFIYNLVGIPLAAGMLYSSYGILLNPMIAAAAMAFSSVSVVLNSLRLKWQPLDLKSI